MKQLYISQRAIQEIIVNDLEERHAKAFFEVCKIVYQSGDRHPSTQILAEMLLVGVQENLVAAV
jgi:hypothetical protein